MAARKNPKKDKYLAVTVTEEDIAYAEKQDRYNCAIVRAIQRQVPDALRVTADYKKIRFTLARDDTRYEFITPPEAVENIIKPLDTHQHVEPFSFQLVNPIASTPVQHRTLEQLQNQRFGIRRGRALQRRNVTTKNPQVHTYNRFITEEPPEDLQ